MSLKNTELNIQGIALQKEMIKDLQGHNSYCVDASKKIIESFSAICDKLNGINSIKEKPK